MKVDVVGSKCTWTKELSTSYLINDEILFDTPQGSFKTLYNDYDLTKIKYIIISHFHSDHFMDLHLVIDIIYHHSSNHVTIIAPKGCKEKLISMFKIVEVCYLEEALKNQFSFIECENNKIINLGEYKIKAYKMLHANLDAYGFTLQQDGKTIGFSGDSAMCNNVRKIISKSSIAFVDCAQTKVTNKHLCVEEVVELIKEYPSCKIYPVHISKYSENKLKELDIPFPTQGDIIEI